MLDRTVKAQTVRVSMQKKQIKGDMERADLSSGQLEAACAASELSVLTSGA